MSGGMLSVGLQSAVHGQGKGYSLRQCCCSASSQHAYRRVLTLGC